MTTTVSIAAAKAAVVDKGESLEAAWEEACEAFRAAAKIDLKTAKAPDAEDIRAKFDKKRAKDAADSVKIDKAKSAFSKTVTVVHRMGGIAAMGASMVFGSPAGIAQNALSFFIDAGVNYRNVFHNIEDILTRIVVVFERFQVYMDNQGDMPKPMIRVANKLLIAVVSICGLCTKTLSRNKFKTFMDMTLFSNDKGVAAQLAKLTALEAEESQMKGTLNLVAAENTKKTVTAGFAQTSEGIGKISANMQRMEAAEKEEKDLKELKEKLQISKDATHHDGYRKYVEQLTEHPESCEWLSEDSVYKSWVQGNGDQKPVLVLKGSEGCGKSFTATAIVKDLISRFPQKQQNADRASVAYFYISGGGKEREVASVSDVLRQLVWQVAQNDLFYRKSVVGICKEMQQLGGSRDVWQQLFLDCSEAGAAYFLVIDGIQELDAKEQDLLIDLIKSIESQSEASRSIRLLIPARTRVAESLQTKLPSTTATLDLAERNEADIKSHIQAVTEEMMIFQKQSEKVQELRQAVCNGVAEAVRGSFLSADYILREISGKYDPAEVMAIVERAKETGGDLADSFTDVIKKCNQTLGAKDLQDLNTLLLWVIHSEWVFDLGELEALIFLQRGAASLNPLYNQISQNFAGFFTIAPDEDESYATVSLKSDSIADYFQNLSNDQNPTVSTANKPLSKGEIKLVQNFIQKLCEQDTYERLGLDTFFDEKLSESDTTIFVDCQNAHALMIIDCMKVLVGDAGSEADGLKNYAGKHLPTHLKKLDLDIIDPKYKAEMGPLLIKLFKDPEGIKNSYTASWVNTWTYNDDLTKHVVRLMRSSAVMKRVMAAGGEDKDWVNSILDSDTHWIDMLKPTAQWTIHQWLEAESAPVTSLYFSSTLGIYNKIEHFNDPQNVERLDDAPPAEAIPAEFIIGTFEWAKTWVDLDYTAAESVRNLGVTYRNCECWDESFECLKQVLATSKDSLRAHANIASAYEIRSRTMATNEYDLALEHGNILVEATSKGEKIFSFREPEDDLYDWRTYTAAWHRKLGQYEEAATIYRTILEAKPDDYGVVTELLLTYCEQEKYGDVVEYLESMAEKVDEETQTTTLTKIFTTFCHLDEYNARIVRAFKHAGALDKAKQLWEKAIDDARVLHEKALKEAKKPEEQARLEALWMYATTQYNLAVIYHNNSASEEESAQAISLWENILEIDGPVAALYNPKYRSGQRLSPIYMALAIEAGRDSQLANDMVAKIQDLGSTGEEDSPELQFGLPKSTIRSLIGRYYSAVGDKEKAQMYLKQNVDVGVKLLSDDDLDNDWQGWRKLGDAFLDFGDTANAIASWTMIVPTVGVEQFQRHRSISLGAMETGADKSSATPSEQTKGTANGTDPDAVSPRAKVRMDSIATTADGEARIVAEGDDDDLEERPKLHRASTSQLEHKLSGPIGYSCDGDCETTWTYADDIWVCQECLDVQFDEPCLTRLRAGDLPKNICSPTHHFMHVPSFDPSWIERVKHEIVLVGDKEVPMKEWLDAIRKEWGLEEEKAEEDEAKMNGNATANGVAVAVEA